MIRAIRVDPKRNPAAIPLTGIVARRIYDFVAKHDPTQDPATFTGLILARLWAGDEAIYCIALVDEEGGVVVGHFLGWYTDNGGAQKWGFVSQALADGNVGDAMKLAMVEGEAWARAKGCKGMTCVTHRNPEAWAKYGLKATHTLMMKEFEAV